MVIKYIYGNIIAAVILLSAMMILQGCSGKDENANVKNDTALTSAESEKGSAQLWTENCARCHNLRDPSSYSDAQWEVIMHSMRVRADLTPVEHRKILEFLQASN